MRAGLVPPTANFERTEDELAIDVVHGEPRKLAAAPVVSNSFGFGGHNASLVLAPSRMIQRRVTAVPVAARRGGAVQASLTELDGRRVAWFRLGGRPAPGRHRPGRGRGPRAPHPAGGGGRRARGGGAVDVGRRRPGGPGLPPRLGTGGPGPERRLGDGAHRVLGGRAVPGRARPDAGHGRPRGDDRRRLRLRERARRRCRSSPGCPPPAPSWAGPTSTPAAAAWPRWWWPTRTRRPGPSATSCPTCRRTGGPTPPSWPADDPVDRPCRVAATTVPDRPTASYDVRTVIGDVVDRDSFLEVRAGAAPNVVTGYARLAGAPGRRHRQPAQLPGRHPRHRRLAPRRPASSSAATPSASRSSPSSTAPGSSRARTSSGRA